jgi:molybdopterin molybdotransferase
MVGFWRFVEPAIAKLSGKQGPWAPEFVTARADAELTAGGRRETYLWGQLSMDELGYRFKLAKGGHNSGNLVNLVNTSGLGVVPQGRTKTNTGEPVRVLKIR